MAEQYTATIRPSEVWYYDFSTSYTSNCWDLNNGTPNLTTYDFNSRAQVTLKNNNRTFDTLKLDFSNANIPNNIKLISVTYKIVLKRTSNSSYSLFSCGMGYAEDGEKTLSKQNLILSSIKDSTTSPPGIGNGSYANGASNAKKPATLENQITATWTGITKNESDLIVNSGYPLFFISTNGNYYIFNIELEITYEPLPTSQIYIGTSQASAIYVGNTKASAVYIGTTKIL